MNDVQKSTDIPADSRKTFYFYMPDTAKYVELSAVMAESKTPVPLNGQDVYQHRLDDGENPDDGKAKKDSNNNSGGDGTGDGGDGNDRDSTNGKPTSDTTQKSLVVKGNFLYSLKKL